MAALLSESFHLTLIAVTLTASLTASAHALLNKRDPRSAAAWIALCMLFPVIGVLAYLALGVNRIRTRARRLHDLPLDVPASIPLTNVPDADETAIDPRYRNQAALGRAVSQQRLCWGNHVLPLVDGDMAYPAMLDAIAGAQQSIWLATYIFDTRGAGRAFVDALVAARARGVEVKVLVDGIGELYSWPLVSRALGNHGLSVARFLPPGFSRPAFSINLRNHRKLLIVDGRRAFTGGMNIRTKHRSVGPHAAKVRDIHFAVDGAVVAQLAAVFANDWRFTTGEQLRVPDPMRSDGMPACRVISDGPNEDLDKILWLLVGAISLAQHRIVMMTPYFVPPRELLVALQTAALRGVKISLLLPQTNNFQFMNWAAMHAIGPLLKTGVEVQWCRGRFVHSKLFVVDDYYALIGSSNLDQRSLRLNFELAVEVFDGDFAGRLTAYFDAMRADADTQSLKSWASRALPVRLRDGFCWLFSPYL